MTEKEKYFNERKEDFKELNKVLFEIFTMFYEIKEEFPEGHFKISKLDYMNCIIELKGKIVKAELDRTDKQHKFVKFKIIDCAYSIDPVDGLFDNFYTLNKEYIKIYNEPKNQIEVDDIIREIKLKIYSTINEEY